MTAAQAVWLQALLAQTRLAGDIERSHMRKSINFDRAASIYDATRKLPDATSTKITDAFLREIRATGADRVLEVGIGTGRMARPLMAHGVRMTGVDISPQMMTRLLGQLTAEHTPPDLLLGDATALPFRDGAFRAAMVVHVLHLVSSVEETLAEIRRVLLGGGVLLHQTRRATPETKRFWDESYDEWGRLLQARNFLRRSRFDEAVMREKIADTGASLRLIDVAGSAETSTVDDELERLRNRTSSWTWQVPSDVFDDALPEYERWLRAAVPGGSWTDDVTIELEVWT
jgi:ubiquinone/menaquinone biosynthesis C-methylase UbiE